ncbi:uncharacterized protein [Diabrotica undecimpunctata]|uniref:uncharacterized protein isoform X2 n=1 Tax=Diabrotica undecimpunctata TaxID=50387 RepID=UPI003B63F4FE
MSTTSGNSVATVKNVITVKGLDFSVMPDATRHHSVFYPEPKISIPTDIPTSTRSTEVNDFDTCPISGYGTTIVKNEYYSKLQKEHKCNLYDGYEDFSKTFIGFKIVEWIDSTAEVTENWLYSIMMVCKSANHISDFYKYEAIFSLPTKCYPISQATASVFFDVEVSRVMSEFCPVNVTFQLESFSSKLSPKTHVITDALLFRVIDAKIKIFKSYYF